MSENIIKKQMFKICIPFKNDIFLNVQPISSHKGQQHTRNVYFRFVSANLFSTAMLDISEFFVYIHSTYIYTHRVTDRNDYRSKTNYF